MSTVQKILLFAVGLLITVGLISISFGIFDRVKDSTNVIEEENNKTIYAIREDKITKYDNMYISGALAVSYVRSIYSEVDNIFVLPTGKNMYDAKNVSEDTLYYHMKTSTDDYYVNPLQKFYVEVVRNANGVITGVKITEQS